jgi:cytochrome P450
MAASMTAGIELAEYFEHIASARRAAPTDDLVSLLVGAQDAGRCSYGEVLGFCLLLLIAGNETTTNLLGNAMIALAAHPDQLTEISHDRSLIPAAIEEVLRFDSPVQGLTRKTTTEVEMHGELLPVGAQVMVLWAAANRDEREFDQPDTFNIHRPIKRTVAFGHGLHYCLGAALARLEARVAFEEMVSRFNRWEVDGPIEWIRSGPVRGPEQLHLGMQQ